MFQIPFSGFVIRFDDLLITVKQIMPIRSQNTGASPRNNIIKVSQSRNRKYIRKIARTLRWHQPLARIIRIPLHIQKIVVRRMLCRPHIQQELLPQFPSVFHIEDRRRHQMIRFLPCKTLDRRTVGMYADHIGFHRFFHKTVNLLITFVITGKCTVRLPRAADRVGSHIPNPYFRSRLPCLLSMHPLNRNVTPCKISKFHPAFLPPVISPDDIGNAGIQIHPAFRHLVDITVFCQFLSRIDPHFIAAFSEHFKLQYSGHILSEIINLTSVYISETFARIRSDHFHGRLTLLCQSSGWLFLFWHKNRLFPFRRFRLEQPSVDRLRTIDIAHHNRMSSHLK